MSCLADPTEWTTRGQCTRFTHLNLLAFGLTQLSSAKIKKIKKGKETKGRAKDNPCFSCWQGNDGSIYVCRTA